MANSLNKFKGVRACVCTTPENAKVAREQFGMNTLVLGSKFFDKPDNALKIVDTYLQTKAVSNPTFAAIDKLGCSFNKEILKRIEIDPKIVIPKELQ